MEKFLNFETFFLLEQTIEITGYGVVVVEMAAVVKNNEYKLSVGTYFLTKIVFKS